MAIIQTVNFNTFKTAFANMGRGEQFSDDALQALFDHLESISEDTGEPYDLDVIELCCDYSEETAESVLDEDECAKVKAEYLDSLNTDGFTGLAPEDHPDFDACDYYVKLCEAAKDKLDSEGRLVAELGNGDFLTKD